MDGLQTEKKEISRFSFSVAVALLFLSAIFNYLSIVLSSFMYGNTGPAAYAPLNVIGGNMLFFGTPFALSMLFIAMCSWVLHMYFHPSLWERSALARWFSVLLFALVLYALISAPLLYTSHGIYGLGMTVIWLLRASLGVV